MNERCYAAGSSFPALSADLPRLYSMRFCPYSQRVRLVLASKKVKYETININSKRRPEWLNEISTLGMPINHPTIQFNDGKVITDSLTICEYLDAVYTTNKLIPSEPYEKACHMMLIEGFQRVAALLYKGLKFKDAESYNEINKVLEYYEKFLSEKYFGGKNPGLTDFMIWPWFERFESLKSLTNYQLDEKRFTKLTKWVKRMFQIPVVKETNMDEELMAEFYKVSVTNKEPDYDLGLPPVEEAAAENA